VKEIRPQPVEILTVMELRCMLHDIHCALSATVEGDRKLATQCLQRIKLIINKYIGDRGVNNQGLRKS